MHQHNTIAFDAQQLHKSMAFFFGDEINKGCWLESGGWPVPVRKILWETFCCYANDWKLAVLVANDVSRALRL
jgi:hypothetical protein